MKRQSRYVFILVVFIVLNIAVFSTAGCGRPDSSGKESAGKAVYHCPMHPQYVSDRPGDCPICGMKLVKIAEKQGNAPEGKTALAPEKTLQEVCVEHKCTMKGCTMGVMTHLKPGERMLCPVCGEVISTASGKVVEIAKQLPQAQAFAPASKERKISYYRNPMNPESTSPVPMKDSMGMDYIPVYEETKNGKAAGPTITISPEKQQLIGVKIEPVKKMALAKIVRASGKIAYDPELVVTQEEFIQAMKNEENVKDSPLQDVLERAKSMTEAARHKLKLLGMGDDQISELSNTKKSQTNLYLPAKGESVWAYISIYEYEVGLIHAGDDAEIEAVAYPGEVFAGKVVSISPVLDPGTRTNQVRIEVPNTDNKLKPEMFVNAKIKVSLGEKLAVPESAVLDTGLRKIVYLLIGEDELESVEIRVGQKAEGYYEVSDGLKEGDMVVTSGNFLVDSESKLRSAGN